ncbi:DHHW family protein [Turicibacter bilis]|uniref:DHHW family protein n=1 Tax=Turicibacter bilis TaxID=2735723 RepID=UPI0031BAA73A
MRYKYFSSIIICSMIIFISLSSIVTPDKEVSELEGRTLEVIPLPSFIRDLFKNDSENILKATQDNTTNEQSRTDDLEVKRENAATDQLESNIRFYLKGILNGDYFNRWDKYFSDHIVGRDYFVSIYTQIQKMLNKNYINGVYFGKDDYLFSLPTYSQKTEEELEIRAQFFNELANKYNSSQLYLVNLPNKHTVYEEKNPISGFISPYNGEFSRMVSKLDKNILVLDMEQYLTSDASYFYKTDHHWNMNGAYTGYSYIINQLRTKFSQIPEVIDKGDFQIEKYKSCFVGSDGRKVGQLVDFKEDIEIWNHEAYSEMVIEINGKRSSFYHLDNIDERSFNNDYLVYMDGNNSLEIITNNDINNDLSLVLIGDSMSNPLIPLLSLHFKNIYSYDMRHYKGDVAADLQNLNPDIIMLISLNPNIVSSDSDIININ